MKKKAKKRSKRNNNSSDLREWTTNKLKAYAATLDDCIRGANACYGTRDLLLEQHVLDELDKRGVAPVRRLSFIKGGL